MVSKKKKSGFHNQNLCENLNRAIFARTSWFLAKVHIKANSCRITLFEQFRILKWRNKPQKWNLREKLGKIGPSWIFFFCFLVHICAKVNFWKLDICTISELRMKKWVPKSECTRKIEWDKSVLAILTFWSRSRVHLVKAFSLSLFLI